MDFGVLPLGETSNRMTVASPPGFLLTEAATPLRRRHIVAVTKVRAVTHGTEPGVVHGHLHPARDSAATG